MSMSVTASKTWSRLTSFSTQRKTPFFINVSTDEVDISLFSSRVAFLTSFFPKELSCRKCIRAKSCLALAAFCSSEENRALSSASSR